MVRCLMVAFLMCWSALGKAQSFAVVNDPDGYVNIRKAETVKSPAVWKAYNGAILTIYEEEGRLRNWMAVSTPSESRDSTGKTVKLKAQNLQGFVYTNRLKLITKLTQLKNRREDKHRLTIKNDSILFSLSTRPFQPANHKVQKKNNFVNDIDGKHPYGVDGDLPHIEIVNINLTINGKNIAIPTKIFNDLYEPTLREWNVYLDGRTIYIKSQNSDGAGAYSLIFVISDGKLIRRYLENSEA